MELTQLSGLLIDYYKNPGSDLLITIPAGTGICHIPFDVKVPDWRVDFVSKSAGRWKEAGELKKHFGQYLTTCSYELYGGEPVDPDNTICEIWQANKDFLALNIPAFPDQIRETFYEDFGAKPQKWEKPNLAMKLFYQHCDYSSGIYTTYAPSASGKYLGDPSMVLVTNPQAAGLVHIETGSYSYYQNLGHPLV